MIRTQISLTVDQHRRLKRRAARDRVSMADLIRRLVDDGLSSGDRAVTPWDPSSIIGLGAGGAGDVSRDHDRHLDTIADDELRGWERDTTDSDSQASRD